MQLSVRHLSFATMRAFRRDCAHRRYTHARLPRSRRRRALHAPARFAAASTLAPGARGLSLNPSRPSPRKNPLKPGLTFGNLKGLMPQSAAKAGLDNSEGSALSSWFASQIDSSLTWKDVEWLRGALFLWMNQPTLAPPESAPCQRRIVLL